MIETQPWVLDSCDNNMLITWSRYGCDIWLPGNQRSSQLS
jgi:hypothetical protein